MKKRLQKFKHNITPRARKDRSGIQKLSTDKQKLIASLKARNPYAKNYTPNLPPHSKPRPKLPKIDTSKKYLPYVPGPRTPGAFVPDSFFANKMVKGPSTPKGIPPPRTPTGPKPKSAFGGKSRRKRRRKKNKTRRRKKKKTRRRRKKNMRGCSKKRRRR